MLKLPSLVVPLVFYALLSVVEVLAELVARPCTRPGETALAYSGDGRGISDLYEALTTCSDITSLDLYFTWTGCVLPQDPWSFNFKKGDRFPPLHALAVHDYDFEDGFRSQQLKTTWKWWITNQVQDRLGRIIPRLKFQSTPEVSNLEKWLHGLYEGAGT